uniref:Strictosidine synthase conserved region domain-containing protein n=1 Tax=Panagrolaimus sp. PS1159 TaxID=55785 RepID=A0AC35FY89_9BILA
MNKIAILALALGYLSYSKMPKEWEKLKFEVVELKTPPAHTGPLEQNDVLENAEILFKDEMNGPESIVIEGDTIYVSAINELVKIVNGKIVKKIFISTTKDCLKNPVSHCGRPLGIRRLNKDVFIFADGVKGLLTVNFETEEVKTLIHAGKKYDGRWISFADDVDVIDEDNVVFTDATWLYDESTISPSFFGALATGRVYKYNIKSDTLTLLMDEMYFSNGIQIMPDKQSFIVSETLTARIHRHYFSGPKKGLTEIFMDNLPGHPDNVRLSSDKKTIWIAFAVPRIAGKYESFDQILRYPSIRKFLHNYMPHTILTWIFQYFNDPKTSKVYGIAVQADLEGNIRRSFHSPKGTVNNLSQMTDDGKYLYFCTYANSFLARIKL